MNSAWQYADAIGIDDFLPPGDPNSGAAFHSWPTFHKNPARTGN